MKYVLCLLVFLCHAVKAEQTPIEFWAIHHDALEYQFFNFYDEVRAAELNGLTLVTCAAPLATDNLLTALNKNNSCITQIKTKTDNIQTWSINNAPGRSIVSAINAANGFQISSTRIASASYSVTIMANATGLLAGASTGYVVFEICPTNSAVGANWIEVGRWTNGQKFTSILTLTSEQPVGSDISKYVPAGYYVRLRSVNVNGTPTYAVTGQQEALLPF